MTENKILSIEEFCKIATHEQMTLLSDLSDLVQKEIELAKKINAIYGSISKGIYSTEQGITLCEDTDDANVISLSLKVELKDLREKIAGLLNKAIDELSMGNVGLIQRQHNNYVKRI